jgi:hypothetical protein
LEENPTTIDLGLDRTIEIPYRPFQIMTLRLRRA